MKAWFLNSCIRLAAGGIESAEAQRQERTAAAILERLAQQPGLILADEVGMGKTFVALAVLASVAWASGKPAVVMAPPRLVSKWSRDAGRFSERCIASDADGRKPRFECRRADTGAAFLKCFDDPPDRACQLVLLANTALHRDERDPWVRLAAMQRALPRTQKPDRTLRVVARFAQDLLPGAELAALTEQQVEELLSLDCARWRVVLQSWGVEMDDDPVPVPFIRALTTENLKEVAQALEEVPVRVTDTFNDRIRHARRAVSSALRHAWKDALANAEIQSPLLVFDEAHHLKNADTRLAKLFQSSETADTSVVSGAFDRMVFLTATPFQLGHSELVEVLRRFRAVHWDALAGSETPETFANKLDALEETLNGAQSHALGLDALWGRLQAADFDLDDRGELTAEAEGKIFRAGDEAADSAAVAVQYRKVREEFRKAQGLLRPWIIRHLRDREMTTEDGRVQRRRTITGRGIQDGQPSSRGLELTGAARFPFLLCARAQGVLARDSDRRAYFAEGLASSFGAFRDTVHDQGKPTDDADVTLSSHDPEGHVGWYVREVDAMLGEDRDPCAHPKISATVERAIQEWKAGHKVLIFGHYRKTIDDLTTALQDRVALESSTMASKALRMSDEDARAATDRITNNLRDADSLLRREVHSQLEKWIEEFQQLGSAHTERIVGLLIRTLSEPSFIARNFPLDRAEVRARLDSARPTAEQAREAASAVVESLQRRKGRGQPSFQSRVFAFLRHLGDDLSSDKEREELLDKLDAGRGLTTVEKAYGLVDEAARERRLLGFNGPLLPDILVASEVMAEGLDLHLDCRHVIHHDLSWNPSTLEQRTGRVDRLRCRAEADRESIDVFLPYLEGTADEKMYRVVSDRARWFQVVMGERYRVDEASTEALARRIPFPENRALELMFDLSVKG